jgi:Fe2+ transport system protein FeoA
MFSGRRNDQRDGVCPSDYLSLAHLKIGQSGRIKAIEGNDAIAGRLLEMGLTPGSPTRVLGAAFSGDPIEIEIRNYRLTLRRSEAERVLLESIAGESR